VGGALGLGEAAPLRHQLVKAEADDLASNRRGGVVVRGGGCGGGGVLRCGLLGHGSIVSQPVSCWQRVERGLRGDAELLAGFLQGLRGEGQFPLQFLRVGIVE